MNAIAKPQSYADAAATALRHSIAATHAPLRDAVAGYRTANAGLASGADLLDVLRAVGGLVLAAEAIVAVGAVQTLFAGLRQAGAAGAARQGGLIRRARSCVADDVSEDPSRFVICAPDLSATKGERAARDSARLFPLVGMGVAIGPYRSR
jgi:hypothetical protein